MQQLYNKKNYVFAWKQLNTLNISKIIIVKKGV